MNNNGPGAQHVQSRLMRESLVDKNVIARTESPVTAILPDVNVIQIGGRSIMDRGCSALLPLLDEIVANQSQHRMIIGVGAGVRTRHILSVGLDLGLPTGVLAALSAKDSAQNAYMVSCLLAKHGFVYLEAPFVVESHALHVEGHAGSSAGRSLQRHSSLLVVGASSGFGQAASSR